MAVDQKYTALDTANRIAAEAERAHAELSEYRKHMQAKRDAIEKELAQIDQRLKQFEGLR